MAAYENYIIKSEIQEEEMCVVATNDSLEREVSMRAGAKVLGVVQAGHLSGCASTRDARQEAGGPTLAALLLLIWERLVINLSRLYHTLGTQITERIMRQLCKKTNKKKTPSIF